jgi:hypothetical protein
MADKLEPATWAILMAGAAASLPGEESDVAAWASKVAERAAAMAQAMGRAEELSVVANSTKTFTGVVVSVANPAVSESGKTLNLAHVHLQSDVGTRPDFLWVDLTTEAGQNLANLAEGLVGHRVRFTRRNEPQMNGNAVALDKNGEPITRPRLVSIEPLDLADEKTPPVPNQVGSPRLATTTRAKTTAPSSGASTSGATGVSPSASVPASDPVPAQRPNGESATETEAARPPTTNAELRERAEALGWRVAEIRAISEELLGPVVFDSDGRPVPRSPEELGLLWNELVRRAVAGVP